MAQFYTLEEAARVLGLSSEDLKSKAQHREIRAFLDGGSWRFRVVDIDELARRRGGEQASAGSLTEEELDEDHLDAFCEQRSRDRKARRASALASAPI